MTRRVRAVRRFLTPGWIAVHLLVAAVVVVMIGLGRWQLRVSDDKHFDLQNFSYTLQWWAFSACALFFWLRVMRDALREPAPNEQTGTSAGGQLVLRGGEVTRLPARYQGPAAIVSETAGGEPVVYRGYVIPESSSNPHRSYGDGYHDAYNDYLWQLSLADSAGGSGVPPRSTAPRVADEPTSELER